MEDRATRDEQHAKAVGEVVLRIIKEVRSDERERTLAAVKVRLGEIVNKAGLDEILNQ